MNRKLNMIFAIAVFVVIAGGVALALPPLRMDFHPRITTRSIMIPCDGGDCGVALAPGTPIYFDMGAVKGQSGIGNYIAELADGGLGTLHGGINGTYAVDRLATLSDIPSVVVPASIGWPTLATPGCEYAPEVIVPGLSINDVCAISHSMYNGQTSLAWVDCTIDPSTIKILPRCCVNVAGTSCVDGGYNVVDIK